MLEQKRTTPLLALVGAAALLVAAPAMAQTAAPADNSAAASSNATTTTAANTTAANTTSASTGAGASGGDTAAPIGIKHAGKLTPVQMFIDATPVVKVVMIGLLLASMLSWIIFISKIIEFARLNRQANNFVESFRGARSIADINRMSSSEEFQGNPLADMAAAASGEVELSRQAGLQVAGEHRDSTVTRAAAAVGAVQAGLARRLSGGMQFLASVGSSGPFIGLFGTVYGIMNSFIGIANTNTTNLAVVAPGIAEALLATGIGLFAAIPSVIFYNYFQTRIAAFGTRSEGFVAELMNAISRQLDRGA